MIRSALLGLMSLVISVGPALAQQASSPPNPSPAATSSVPSGVPTSPDLTVATVKLQGGLRISKLIGSAVYNDQNEKVGTVDDLIMKDGNQIVMAVVSVGGFLGIGNKLVAVPYDQIHLETDNNGTKVAMPGASKDALNAMPTFTYGG
ncbi:PRC-barrel domain-containing protein [Rhodopila sp.]|uniref:PRC-barrel domain-containing protein n=1 Tax=Rhodopila sp. TaxID=2480087 RepID=UPI003D10F46B